MNARKEDVDDYVTLNELLVNYWTRVSQDEATLEDIVAEYKSRPEEGVVRGGRGSSDEGGRGAARHYRNIDFLLGSVPRQALEGTVYQKVSDYRVRCLRSLFSADQEGQTEENSCRCTFTCVLLPARNACFALEQ